MIETDIFFVLKPGSIQAVGFGVIPNSFSHKFMKEKKKGCGSYKPKNIWLSVLQHKCNPSTSQLHILKLYKNVYIQIIQFYIIISFLYVLELHH